MIIKQYQKPFVPKYANYDYIKVYYGNDRFIGWIRIYYELAKVVEQMDEDELRYCHHDDTDEYHDCLDYIDMECEECPYYYEDSDQESD